MENTLFILRLIPTVGTWFEPNIPIMVSYWPPPAIEPTCVKTIHPFKEIRILE
uniref:Uncharacterized protein n=1 Tax=Lotus japonicus TaxID=34305 RepID=I3S4D2_LOTJA|nr:unknown [Lotus japonicus]